MNIAPQTMYGWFHGDNDPSLGALATLADRLGVKRWEIVAVMDGDVAVIDPLAVRVEKLEAMMKRMAAGGLAPAERPERETPRAPQDSAA